MQAMICLTMTYEVLCATCRAAAAVANVVYVPSTMLEYLDLINRPAHSAHVATVAAAIAGGKPLPAGLGRDAIPFSEVSAAAYELQRAFDVHVALLHSNVEHAGTQGPALNTALNAAQALKSAHSIATSMKDCHANFAIALLDWLQCSI